MFLPIILIILGSGILVKGADWLVESGVGIALKSGIPRIIVGLTIVAYGTSAPELATSVVASLKGSGGICYGNVIGSNVANIILILGASAIFYPLVINRRLIKWEIPFMIGISVLAYAVGIMGYVGRIAGVIFLLLFVYYMVKCLKTDTGPVEIEEQYKNKKYPVLFGLFIISIAMVAFGAALFVNGAQSIARLLGVSETVIGLTIVGIGTSLPELITSIVAARRKEPDISVGNIIGSNIFNILFVLGVSASIFPFRITPDRFLYYVGLPFMMGSAILLFLMCFSGRILSKLEGFILVSLFIIYISLAVIMA